MCNARYVLHTDEVLRHHGGVTALRRPARGLRRPPWLARKDVGAFLMQQDHFDRLLEAEGFRDVENGGDMNRRSASTLSAMWPETRPGGHRPITRDDGSAELWEAIRRAVADLPSQHPRHAFFDALVDCGLVSEAARRACLTYEAGRWALRVLLQSIGLPDARLHMYPRRRS